MTHSPVAQELLDWIATSIGAASVRWIRSLPGGTHAMTDLIALSDGAELVVRRFPTGDGAVRQEMVVLDALTGLGTLVPMLVAADPDGLAGLPTIVTTLVVGSAWLTPNDPLDFAAQLGVTLAEVHAHPPGEGLPDLLTATRRGSDPRVQRIFEEPRVLTHNDFWSGNTLWHDGLLTGVVDWSGAGIAPRGYDLSWGRLDLVLLFDRMVADAFTSAYESAARVKVADVDLWDRFAAAHAHPRVEDWAPNYQELGRSDLGAAALRQRLTAWESELDTARP